MSLKDTYGGLLKERISCLRMEENKRWRSEDVARR